jgi:hypothetical protein
MQKEFYPKVQVIFLVVLLFITGCTSNIDRHKFENVDRLAALVEKEAEKGTDYGKFEKELQDLSAAISSVREVMTTKEEIELLHDYAELLMAYQDGQLLWRYEIESSLYPWVPRGRVYADDNIKALASKYGLPMESHVIEITGHRFETVSAGSVKEVLEKARIKARAVRGRLPLF